MASPKWHFRIARIKREDWACRLIDTEKNEKKIVPLAHGRLQLSTSFADFYWGYLRFADWPQATPITWETIYREISETCSSGWSEEVQADGRVTEPGMSACNLGVRLRKDCTRTARAVLSGITFGAFGRWLSRTLTATVQRVSHINCDVTATDRAQMSYCIP